MGKSGVYLLKCTSWASLYKKKMKQTPEQLTLQIDTS